MKIETLKRAKAELDKAGIQNGAADHGVSKSLSLWRVFSSERGPPGPHHDS